MSANPLKLATVDTESSHSNCMVHLCECPAWLLISSFILCRWTLFWKNSMTDIEALSRLTWWKCLKESSSLQPLKEASMLTLVKSACISPRGFFRDQKHWGCPRLGAADIKIARPPSSGHLHTRTGLWGAHLVRAMVHVPTPHKRCEVDAKQLYGGKILSSFSAGCSSLICID